MGGGNAYRPPGPGPGGPGPSMGGGNSMGGGHTMGGGNSMRPPAPSTASPGGGRPAPSPVRTPPGQTRKK